LWKIAVQSVFVTGFEPSSTTMSFALYELAKNQDIQEKIREEVKSVLAKYDGKITYEAIHDMKDIDLVLSGKCYRKNFASENTFFLQKLLRSTLQKLS
jgi:cytochrome P450